MKKNMGMADRTIRAIIAIAIAALYYTGVISGTLGIVLLIVACTLLLTGIFSFCPLYIPFKLKTNKEKESA